MTAKTFAEALAETRRAADSERIYRAVRLLGNDHEVRTLHRWDEPSRRGTICELCDSLHTLNDARPPLSSEAAR